MNKSDITIVCCYNDIDQFDMFMQSISGQTHIPNVISIDNRNKVFSSCAKALNSVIRDVNTKYVLFCHQDIIFTNIDTIEQFEQYCEKLDTKDIFGVAGTAKGEKKVISNIVHGKNRECPGHERVEGLQECDTVDECCFGGRTEFFLDNPFDEILCDDWHLYAVERCLNTTVNEGKVYVCDISLIHASRGALSKGYLKCCYRICKAYGKDLKYINTTCGMWKTGFWARKYQYVKFRLKLIKRAWKNGKKIVS